MIVEWLTRLAAQLPGAPASSEEHHRRVEEARIRIDSLMIRIRRLERTNGEPNGEADAIEQD